MKRIVLLSAALPLVLGACELAPKTSTQNGYRGTGMDTVMVKTSAAADEVPAPPYDLPESSGETAGAAYENVQVLSGVSREEFDYLMAALTEWVAPAEGCNYCHNPANLASDELYTKQVARQMIQMTQAINGSWSSHVDQTGVTCWTCHRGENVPENHWTMPQAASGKSTIVNNRSGQNAPVSNSAYSSLPNAAVALYLVGGLEPKQARVVSKGVYPSSANTLTTKETENTYAMMAHITEALGVNCTYCHNAQSFQSWSTSNPARQTAWHGLDMVRSINFDHITPLEAVLPDNRKGVMGDAYKVNCTTCHQGQNKPLGGAKMAADYPALWQASAAQVPVADADEETEEGAGE